MAVKNLTPLLTDADCRRLAITMLEELNCVDAPHWAGIDPEYWEDGKRQVLVSRRFFKVLERLRNERVTAGFHAVLSDYLAQCLDGALPAVGWYEQYVHSGMALQNKL
jgi:hypothetical protein